MSAATERRQILRALESRFDEVSDLDLLLFGGKGGVGKTTMSLLASLHMANRRPVLLITTDPAGNLSDFDGDLPESITLETIDAPALWSDFLDENLDSFLELGDRGTYLDREELREFFELSIPGVDELMGWNRIAEAVRTSTDAIVVVDTAPTGHTLRLLSSSSHWHAMETVLDSMQDKHREIVSQLTRTTGRDAIDEFLSRFSNQIEGSDQLFRDPSRTAFVPVMIAEPWVLDQTVRLTENLRDLQLTVPFAILNHAAIDCSCAECRKRREREATADERSPVALVRAPRACGLFRTTSDLADYLSGKLPGQTRKQESIRQTGGAHGLGAPERLQFVAGKGGVGKTTIASALALAAAEHGQSVTLLSVDPAHSVDDVFRSLDRPDGLRVETIDTKRSWKKLEADVGRSISAAIDGLTPRGFRNVHDEAITRQLLEISPPGADEIFALIRILELWEDRSVDRIIVDTAPTGHFLRLIALPQVAGAWVRQLMRITLRYKEILSSSSLGQKLLDASRSLREFEELTKNGDCGVVVVTRPEPIVIAETERLLTSLEEKDMNVAQVIVNAVTPATDCRCEKRLRAQELAQIERLETFDPYLIARRTGPPVTRRDLVELVSAGSDGD